MGLIHYCKDRELRGIYSTCGKIGCWGEFDFWVACRSKHPLEQDMFPLKDGRQRLECALAVGHIAGIWGCLVVGQSLQGRFGRIYA